MNKLQRFSALVFTLSSTFVPTVAVAGNGGSCLYSAIPAEAKDFAYSLWESGGPDELTRRFQIPDEDTEAAVKLCGVSADRRLAAEKARTAYLLANMMERTIQANHGITPYALEAAFEEASPASRAAFRSFALARVTNPGAPVPLAAVSDIYRNIPATRTSALDERLVRGYILLVLAAHYDGFVYGE